MSKRVANHRCIRAFLVHFGIRICLISLGLSVLMPNSVLAFCGFYVAKADTKLFNEASKVVLVRDGDRTVLTMANDFKGDPKEFAIVIPVPTFLERGQIHVASQALIDHLDSYSAPRLVEYYDENPCMEHVLMEMAAPAAAGGAMDKSARRAESLGVKIEAKYTVGEYDILILSAQESSGLETWLRENDYKVPEGASEVLGSYIRQNMRFFVAKVNLMEQSKLGFTFLRPLQVAFESPKFMLPIRLGTVNANGPQELFIFALTKNGRIETTNYRTVKLPEGTEIPEYVKDDFPNFYRAMFSNQVEKENMRAVFLEYAWDMGWCDPCAAEPLSNDELRELGVFWLNDSLPEPVPLRGRQSWAPPPPQGANVYITRLHLRYDRDHFPEDLVFQQTGDRTNFQGRYVMRHPWTGSDSCPAAERYRISLKDRHQKEAENLASLTGWEISDIRRRMGGEDAVSGGNASGSSGSKWWSGIWGRQ